MKKVVLNTLIIAALISCRDKCRYHEPAVGNPKIELIFPDSANANVFETQFDITAVTLTVNNGNSVDIELDTVRHSVLFWFNRKNDHSQPHTDNYEIVFDSIHKEEFTISYESSEYYSKGYEDCPNWGYDYVNVIHDGVAYTRPQGSETVKIKL